MNETPEERNEARRASGVDGCVRGYPLSYPVEEF